VRLGKTVVNIGPQGVERQTALEIPLERAISFPLRTAGDADLDALAAEAKSGVDRLAHGAAEADALLELQRDVLGDQLSVKLGLVDFRMSINTSRDVRFWMSALSLSISAPLRR